MSRAPASHPPPGRECVCGGELKQIPLPADIIALAGQRYILIHVETADTRCYPDSDSPGERAATAEPL
jgi:hypothetical protein